MALSEKIDQMVDTLIRPANGYINIERHDLPGTPQNIILVDVIHGTTETKKTCDAIRSSLKKSIKQLLELE